MRKPKSPKAVKASRWSIPASPFVLNSDYALKNFLTAVEAQVDYLYAITESADLDELQAAVYGFTGSIGPLLEAVKSMELNRIPLVNVDHPRFEAIASAVAKAGYAAAADQVV